MTLSGRVAPFGHPRVKACSQLTVAFRSVPRPSSPPDAKASTKCPSTLDPNHPTQPELPEQNLSPRGYLRFCSINFSPKNPLPPFGLLEGVFDRRPAIPDVQRSKPASLQADTEQITHSYRQKPIAHVKRPRPSQSNYVKTLFTMTNNKNHGDKTSIPANRIIPR